MTRKLFLPTWIWVLAALFGASAGAQAPSTGRACTSAIDCEDGLACTQNSCVAGVCRSVPANDLCDDGLFCNGKEICSPAGCQVANESACPLGAVCSEESNSCGPAPTDLKTQLVGPAAASSFGWLELSGPPGEPAFNGGRLNWNTTARSQDGAAMESGTGTFLEDPGSRVDLGSHSTVLADGTAARVSLAWTGGLLRGFNHGLDRGVTGTVVTIEQGSETGRHFLPSNLLPDAESATRDLADYSAAWSIAQHGWSAGQLSVGEEIPPEFRTDVCIQGSPGEIAALGVCGAPFCGCMNTALDNAGWSSTFCAITVAGAITSCAALSGGLAWTSCILAAVSIPGCSVPTTFASDLASCRNVASTCYCDRSLEFPDYSWLCSFANDRKVYAKVTGLRSGERVEVVGTCGVGLGDPANQVGYQEFHGPGGTQLIIECNRTHAFRLEATPVTSPGVAVPSRRTCQALGDPFGPASAIPDEGVTYEFDCSCENSAQCPGKEAFATVSGLQNLPGLRDVAIDVLFEVNNTGVTQNFTGTAATRYDSPQLYFEDIATGTRSNVYPGTIFRGFSPRLLPTGCQVLPRFAPGQTLPADSPGDLHLLDVVCNGTCEGDNCLVDTVVRVSGPQLASRPGGVEFVVQIGNQLFRRFVHQAGDVFLEPTAVGSPFSGLDVINDAVTVGLDSSVCVVLGPTAGTIGASRPFILGQIECQLLEYQEPRLPRNKVPRPRPPGPLLSLIHI